MTVADNTSRNQYTATPSQALFAYTFEIVDKDDIVVLINGIPLSEGTDYTVTGVGSDTGGNIVLTSGTTGGNIVTIYRDMPYARTQNYTNSGDFLASEVNSDFDNLWLAGEQTNRAFSQSIRKPITDSDSISMELPEAANRANKFLKFDSNGAVDLSSGVVVTVQASDVDITDAGGYYTSTNVEGALQEIGADISGLGGISPIVINATTEGMIYATAGAASANDTVWSSIKTKAANRPLVLIVEGLIHTSAGLHWEDRVEAITVIGTTSTAGVKCATDSTMAFRIRGYLDPEKKCQQLNVYNMSFYGGWSDNSYTQGSQQGGGSLDSNWVYASPFEALYCSEVNIVRCHSENSQYDGFSLPRDVDSFKILTSTVTATADDGINPGGNIVGGGVLNGLIQDCDISYCSNVGLHISGTSRNIHCQDIRISRCGKAGADWADGVDISYQDLVIENIGQPDRSDPDFGAYPGDATNVDGFYDNSPGARTPRGLVKRGTTNNTSNISAKNIVVRNLFDRDDRTMYAFEMEISNSTVVDNIDIELEFDNTAVNATYYSNADTRLFTTRGSNFDNKTNVHLKLKGTYDTANRCVNQSVWSLNGTSNTLDVEIINAGTDQQMLVDVHCDDLSNSSIILNGVGGYVQWRTANGVNNIIKSLHNVDHPTTARYGLLFGSGSENNHFLQIELKDCYVLMNATTDDLRVDDFVYIADGDSRPSILSNTNKASGIVIKNLKADIPTLSGGVSVGGGLIQNRGEDFTVENVEITNRSSVQVFLFDNADADFWKILGGYVDTDSRFLNELAATTEGRAILKDVHLITGLASGTDIILKSADNIIQNVSIRRTSANSSAAISSIGANNSVCNNTGIQMNTTTLTSVTGTGSQNVNNNAIS